MRPHAVRPSLRVFRYSTDRVVLGLVCGVAFAPVVAAAAGQVVASSLLVERCRAFGDDPASVAAQFCDSYLRGYLAGAQSAGWLTQVSDKGPQETFFERAWRTRLGRAARAPTPQICLPDSTPMHELVAQLLASADARTSLEGVSAQQLLEGMLRRVYPCGRRTTDGKP